MTRLLESGARPFGSGKGTVTSLLLHGGLIAAAVVLTGRQVIPPREKAEEHPILYVAAPAAKPKADPAPLPKVERPSTPERKEAAPPVRRPEPPRPAPKPAAPRPAPRPQQVVQAPPAPVPTQVPTTIPDPAPNAAQIAAAAAEAATREAAAREAAAAAAASAAAEAAARAAAEGERVAAAARADSAARAGRGRVQSQSAGDVDPSQTFTANQVEREVQIRDRAMPKYPESLRSVNVTGEVVLRYIVGTNGRVESGSIEVVSSPHKLFTDAARRALLDTRFRPAEVGGRAVRQLAEQTFAFRLQ